MGATDNSFPSKFYVTFQREGPQVASDGSVQPQGLLVVTFLNGTTCTTETARFTFSMEETPKGEYIVKFMLSFEGFYDEISLSATVSDGRVYIDSIPTIFVVNPESLIDGNTIQLLQTETTTLSGTVMRDAWPSTLIDGCDIVSKWVQCHYQKTDTSSQLGGVSYEYFFDPTTGIIVSFPSQGFRGDVLLNKLGVASISNGIFSLSDYSDNLNFTLENDTYPSSSGSSSSFSWWLILIPVFVISLVLVVFFVYRALSLKRKNGKKTKTCSNKPLKFNFISNIKVRYFYEL